jgi:hypothetical protein
VSSGNYTSSRRQVGELRPIGRCGRGSAYTIVVVGRRGVARNSDIGLGTDVDMWGAIIVLARRFYVTVPAIAIAVALAWTYAGSTKPEYHATASVVLIGPTAQVAKDVPQVVNPYAALGTATIATALSIDASNSQSLTQIIQAGNATNFSVAENGRGPILDIIATSQAPQRAVSTATQLVSILQNTLADRQKPYAPNRANQITLQVLSPPGLAAKDTSAKKKAEAVSIGVALAIAIFLSLLIDAILRSRSRQRGRRSWEAPTMDAEPSLQRTSVVRP